jgi:hypothetical protein
VLVRAADTGSTITSEYIKVGTLVSGTTYNVTRNLSGLGAKNWAVGTPYQVRGVSGDGWIELNAFDTPRLSIFTQGSTYNTLTENLRLGYLSGMPNSASGIGLYVGDASNYLRYDGSAFRLKGYSLTVDSSGVVIPEANGAASKTGGAFRFSRNSATQFDQSSADINGLVGYCVLGGIVGNPQDDCYAEVRNKMVGAGGTTHNGNAHVLFSATGWDDAGAAATSTVSLEGVSSAASTGWTLTGSLATTSTISERSRSTPLGEWIPVTFAAGNFSAATGNWTLQSGDQVTFAYTLIGKTMTVLFQFDGTDTSAITGTLGVLIPGGNTAARRTQVVTQTIDNGGAAQAGVAFVSAGSTVIQFQSTVAGGGFANTGGVANNTYVRGQITFEIQ